MILRTIIIIIFLNGTIKIASALYLKQNITRKKQNTTSILSGKWQIEKLTHLRPNIQSTTPSYMEFHYMDNFYDNNKSKIKSTSTNFKSPQIVNTIPVKYSIILFRPTLFLLRPINTTYNLPSEIFHTSKDKVNYFINFTNNNDPSLTGSTCSKVNKNINSNKISTYIDKKESNNVLFQENYNIEKTISSNFSKTFLQKFEYTTAYDRIKFFDMYDSDTYPPPSLPIKHKIDLSEYIEYDNEYNRNKVNLSEVDFPSKSQGHNLNRFAKKHVTSDNKNNMSLKENNSTFSVTIKNHSTTPKKLMFSYLSEPASWSDYPFVAVYTYEPAQVHCDCAAISTHWLVSSAMCLYLHSRDLQIEGRSAFVSYCGINWRHPGRIAYVRRSLLHPSFKPLDIARRQLYNIGAVQVTNSMAINCNGWRPIPLMSHQFVADRDGTLATAVGWGLDRYDTRYATSELPLHRLMLYEGLVFSDSCPGHSGYSKAKRLNEESVKNIYCLSLPAYVREENDTVHGSLLLIGGKLIALYLQEERRLWGDQSAQYTGIWRLIPWLHDVAQEMDEQDPLETDI